MEKLFYFVNPQGKVPTEDTIRSLSEEIMKKLTIQKCTYRCGEHVNNPSLLKEAISGNMEEWELVLLLDENRVCVLDAEQKLKFLDKLGTSCQLTGEIAREIVSSTGFGAGLAADDITKAFSNTVANETAQNKKQRFPVARYDAAEGRAYLENADGTREYVGDEC